MRKDLGFRTFFDGDGIPITVCGHDGPTRFGAWDRPQTEEEAVSSEDRTDVRMEKVTRIRRAIAAGCYHVSSADLAQTLIAYMLRNGD